MKLNKVNILFNQFKTQLVNMKTKFKYWKLKLINFNPKTIYFIIKKNRIMWKKIARKNKTQDH